MAAFHSFATSDEGSGENADRAKEAMRAMWGPGHVDQSVRQAIQMCWMMLPEDRKNLDEVEQQMRRLLDRAIRDLREDAAAFGLK